MKLEQYGWNEQWNQKLIEHKKENDVPARVVKEHRGLYTIECEEGTLQAEVSGSFRFHCVEQIEYPSVGDWVTVTPRYKEQKATIQGLLPRESQFIRKEAGSCYEGQVVAANFDYVWIVTSLNQDLNYRRLERYLSVAYESGGEPIIVCTKADISQNVEETMEIMQMKFPNIKVIKVSAVQNIGAAEVKPFINQGSTIVLLGSSGVGKSTLVNWLLQEEKMDTGGIRESDAKGKHTTTHRELLILRQGGILIDTPGMRELQMLDHSEGMSEAFKDIEKLIGACRYNNCHHVNEPGCAVREAIEQGILEEDRYSNYQKLQKEIVYSEQKYMQRKRVEEKKRSLSKNKGYTRIKRREWERNAD